MYIRKYIGRRKNKRRSHRPPQPPLPPVRAVIIVISIVEDFSAFSNRDLHLKKINITFFFLNVHDYQRISRWRDGLGNG